MLYNLVYLLCHILEGVGVYCYASSLHTHKSGKKRDILLTVICYLILYGIFMCKNVTVNSIAMLAVNTVYFSIFYAKAGLEAFLDSVLILNTCHIGEIIVFSISGLFSANASFMLPDELSLLITAIISYLIFYLLLFCIVKIRRKVHPDSIDSTYQNAVLLLFFVSMSICLVSLHNTGFYTSVRGNAVAWIYLLIGSIIALGAGLIYSFDVIQRNQTELINLHNRLQQQEDEENYNKLLTQLDEDQKIMIHDIKNHLCTINLLIDSKSYDDAKKLINDLVNSTALSNKVTKTNNRSLDLIISRYITICNDMNISLLINCDKSDLVILTPDDTTSLFCNLLDNSIESAKQCDTPFIELIIKCEKSSKKHIITITNSCISEPDYDISGNILTTKIDKLKHGFGVKSAERVVKKYNGIMDGVYSPEDKTYSTTIIMYMEDPTLCE